MEHTIYYYWMSNLYRYWQINYWKWYMCIIIYFKNCSCLSVSSKIWLTRNYYNLCLLIHTSVASTKLYDFLKNLLNSFLFLCVRKVKCFLGEIKWRIKGLSTLHFLKVAHQMYSFISWDILEKEKLLPVELYPETIFKINEVV